MLSKFFAGTTIHIIISLASLTCATQTPANEELAKEIKIGVPEAMLEAGTHDKVELLPLLREHLTDPRQPRYSWATKWDAPEAAQIVLAKLGEKEQQQQIACEFAYGNLAEQSLAFEKVGYVGGWFAISHLAAFLPDSKYNSDRYMPQPGIANGDATVGTRQQLAIRTLDTMSLSGGPMPGTEHPILAAPRRSKEWLTYIETHRAELAKLRPTGEFENESQDYCERYFEALSYRPESYSVVEDHGTVTVFGVEQPGFGNRQGFATFRGRNVPVRSWADDYVIVELPSHQTGKLLITKADSKVVSIAIH